VYLKVDFPRHPGKVVVRSVAELEGTGTERKKKVKPKKEKKEKAPKEKKEEGEKG
jgi:hypothetical protein